LLAGGHAGSDRQSASGRRTLTGTGEAWRGLGFAVCAGREQFTAKLRGHAATSDPSEFREAAARLRTSHLRIAVVCHTGSQGWHVQRGGGEDLREFGVSPGVFWRDDRRARAAESQIHAFL